MTHSKIIEDCGHPRVNIRDFDSVRFFENLTRKNKLARKHDFCFRVVSGLEGFEDALHGALDLVAMVAVDETSQGEMELTNTPHKKYFRTVYMFMRHSIEENWAKARQECFDIMREIFRQFCSVLIKQKTRLAYENIVIDSKISFNEIDRYFFTGGACAYFQIEVSKFVSLELNSSEWLEDPTLLQM